MQGSEIGPKSLAREFAGVSASMSELTEKFYPPKPGNSARPYLKNGQGILAIMIRTAIE